MAGVRLTRTATLGSVSVGQGTTRRTDSAGRTVKTQVNIPINRFFINNIGFYPEHPRIAVDASLTLLLGANINNSRHKVCQ